MKECIKCLYNESVENISFNENNVCNYCLEVENLKKKYSYGTTLGENKIKKIIDKI